MHGASTKLAVVAALRGEMAVAEESFLKVLDLEQRLVPDGVEVAGTLINLGNISRNRGDFVTAEERYRHAVDLLESRSPNDLELARAYSALGVIEMSRGELRDCRGAFPAWPGDPAEARTRECRCCGKLSEPRHRRRTARGSHGGGRAPPARPRNLGEARP